MKKLLWVGFVLLCCFVIGIVIINVAGAEERQNDKEPIYNEIRKLEERIMIPHYIDIVDCPPCPEPEKDCNDWEYMSIQDGEKAPEGWEPFGVTADMERNYSSIGDIYNLVHYIWLKRRVCNPATKSGFTPIW